MKVVKEITKNCSINQDGEVIFTRKVNDKEKTVRLNTIEDAISQNLHILENLFVEFLENYESTQVKFGEVTEMRSILTNIQERINSMSASIDPKEVDLSSLVEDLKNSRNNHKKRIYKILKGDSQSLIDLTDAHFSVVQRIKQLQGIIKGTIIQTKELLAIRNDCQQKIIYAHYILAKHELELRKMEIASKSKQKEVVVKAIKDIAGKKANKVIYALKSTTPVNPYKERIESREVKKLDNLEIYLDKEEYNSSDLKRIINIISNARKKLKRVVRKENDYNAINKY